MIRRFRVTARALGIVSLAAVVCGQPPTPQQLQAALNDPHNLAFNEGYRAETLGKLREAAEAYDRAVSLARTDRDRAFDLSRRGSIRGRLGLWKQARADLDAALRLAPDDLTAQFALLEVSRGQGDFRTCADTLKKIELAVAKNPGGGKLLEVNLALERARTTSAWGDLQGALQQYEAMAGSLADFSDLGMLARRLREMSRLRLRLADLPGARALAIEALSTDLRRISSSRRRPPEDWVAKGDRAVAESLLSLGDCHLALGEDSSARDTYQTAWQLAFRVVSPNELYRADLGRARVSLRLLQAGQKSLFFDSDFSGVVDLTEFGDFPAIQFEALGLMGEMLLARKKTAAAIEAFQRAIALVETTRATASAAEKQNYLALQSDYYRWLVEAFVEQKDSWSALAASEALKARQLRETLAPAEAATEPFEQTRERLKKLPAQISADTAIVSYANADWSRTDPIAFVLTSDRLTAVRLPLATLPTLVQKLPRDAVLAAQKREVDARRYDLGSEIALAGLVAYFRECIDCPPNEINSRLQPMFATGQVLDQLLFAPLENLVAGNARLLVSPSGLLAYLPFDMLVSASGHALVENYAVTLTPSLLATQLLAARPAESYSLPLLAFGGAVYNPANYDQVMADAPAMQQEFEKLAAARQAVFRGAPSPYAGRFGGPANNLAGTKAEVMMLHDLVPASQIELGRDVSEGHVRELAARGELARARVVHFAVHGMAMPQMPELSGILLSDENVSDTTPADRDGFLQITEIAQLPIRAELVTLSACQTGLGAIIAGEGVVGLTSSLFSAGADNVLASLWPVNDASTAYFMRRFYQLHLIENVPTDLAVAQVKREFIQGKAGNFRHPQFWAPFNLYGGRDLLGAK